MNDTLPSYPRVPVNTYAVERLRTIAALLGSGESWERKAIELDAERRPSGVTIVRMPFDGPALVAEGEDLVALFPRRAERDGMLEALQAERAFRKAAEPYLNLETPERAANEARLIALQDGVKNLMSFDEARYLSELESEPSGEDGSA